MLFSRWGAFVYRFRKVISILTLVVAVGALAPPGLDQAVDLVGLCREGRSRGMGLASLRHFASIVS